MFVGCKLLVTASWWTLINRMGGSSTVCTAVELLPIATNDHLGMVRSGYLSGSPEWTVSAYVSGTVVYKPLGWPWTTGGGSLISSPGSDGSVWGWVWPREGAERRQGYDHKTLGHLPPGRRVLDKVVSRLGWGFGGGCVMDGTKLRSARV